MAEGEPVSCLRRVRTADGRRVVDVTDWCRIEHLAPEELPAIAEGSIYARARGPRAGRLPRRRGPHAAQRRRRPRAAARRAARDPAAHDRPGRPHRRRRRRARLARAPRRRRVHVHAPAARARRVSDGAPLVVGVDVGSQGTCAQALEPDGTLVATSYAPHDAALPAAPAGRSRTPASGRPRSSRTLSEVRAATARPRDRRAVLRLPARRARGRRRRTAAPLHPALIWCDRRAGEECDAARRAHRSGRAARAHRLQPRPRPRRRRRSPGSPATSPSRTRAAAALPAARLVGGLARLRRRSPSIPSNALVDGPARPAHARLGAGGLRGLRRRSGAARAGAAAGRRARPDRAAGCARRRAWTAGTLVVLGAGDEMAATLGAGVVEPGVVCDVHGHGRAGLRGGRRARARPDRARRAPSARRSRHVAAGEPRAGCPAAPTAGSATSSAARRRRAPTESGADVYELLNALAECAPPGADGVSWVPALAGAMAPEWNPRARAGWFGMTAAHGRAHLARALLEGNALALRDVIEAIAGAGARRRARSCASAAGRKRAAAARAARARHRPAGVAARTTSRRPRAARRCSPRRARGCTRRSPPRRARWPGPRGEPVQPDPELRGRLRRAAPPPPAALRCAAPAVRRRGGVRLMLDGVLDGARGGRSRRATSGELDLLVVGGGITGAGAALDAATRGLRVALVEARDLAAGRLERVEQADPRRAALPRDGRHRAGPRGAARARAAADADRAPPRRARAVPVAAARPRLGARLPRRGARALRHARRRALGPPPPPPEPARRAARSRRRCAPDALVGAVQFHDAAEDDARMVARRRPHGGRPRRARRHARPGHRIPAARARSRPSTTETGETLRPARPARGGRGRRLDGPAARARRRALGAADRAVQGHPPVRRARAHPDGHRRARAHGEERALHHPVAGRLADRRHGHAVAGRARRGGGDRRRRRLPAGQGQRAAGRAARARGRPRRHGGPAPARRRGGAQRHDADQPPPRGRVADRRAHDDRGRQVHDLPRDGRRARRRGRRGRSGPRRRPSPATCRCWAADASTAPRSRPGPAWSARRSMPWCAATATTRASSST